MISDKGRIEVTGGSVPTSLSAGLLQRYTIAGTADIVIKRLQSVQNTAARLVSGTIFRDHHYFTQHPVASNVAKNRFQEHDPVSTYTNSAYRPLTDQQFSRLSLVAGINWISNAKSRH